MKSYLKVLADHEVHLLGGDTATGRETQLATTATGWCEHRPLSRLGLKPGDLVLGIGAFGPGPALGLRLVLGLQESTFSEKLFRPKPDLSAPHRLRLWLKSAIDVSDGLATSLCILSELNRVSFDVDFSSTFFSKSAVSFCRQQSLPISSLFFAEHGDYQFLVVCSPKNLSQVLRFCPEAKILAKVTSGKKSSRMRNSLGQWTEIPLDYVFNASKSTPAEVQNSLKNWIELSKKLKLA